MSQLYLFLMMFVSLIISGVLVDLGMKNTGGGFMIIFLLLLMISIVKYLDRDIKSVSSDNKRVQP